MKKGEGWKSKVMTILLGLIFVMHSWAFPCNSEGGTTKAGNSSASQSTLSGKLLDADHAPVQGALVIVMHRLTDAKFQTTSDSTGGYTMPVDPGPYDLGVFVQDHAQYAGPIMVAGKTSYDMTVDGMGELTAGQLYGTIKDKDGAPMAGVKVILHANEGAPISFPHGEAVETDALGAFHFEDVPKSYFDLVLSGEGIKAEEKIDIMKDSGPCRVDFRAGTPHLNGWRPGMEASGIDRASGSYPNCTVTPSTPIQPNGIWYLVLGCGTGVYGTHEGQNEINCGAPCPISCWEVSVVKDGAWKDKYAVHFWNTSFTSETGSIYYKFTDSEDQVIKSGWISTQGEHAVNFTSNGPAIKTIYYEYD